MLYMDAIWIDNIFTCTSMHRFGTPVAPGLAPCGTWSVTHVAPLSHLQLWVPNLVPF